MGERLHHIDWLRALAVLLLLPFHTLRVFNLGEDFYVKSPYLSAAVNYVIGFIDVWHMPLLFMLAGMSAYFALAKRTPGGFLAERITRLTVPLFFGILVLIPPQTYLGATFNSGYSASFLDYLVSGDFLVWNIRDGGDYYGGFGIGHLWFILFLFVLTLVALPIWVWWRSEKGGRLVVGLSRGVGSPAWWPVLAVVMWLAEGLGEVVGKDAMLYLFYMLLGYAWMADEGPASFARRRAPMVLSTGALGVAVYVASWPWRSTLPDPSLPLMAVNIAGQLAAWTLIVGLLGMGQRHLDRPSAALAYLGEASYPLYLIHQTAIVLVAWWVVRLPGPWVLQWGALLLAATVLTFGAYEVVRRVGPLRWLMGMRPRR